MKFCMRSFLQIRARVLLLALQQLVTSVGTLVPLNSEQRLKYISILLFSASKSERRVPPF